MRIIAGSCRGRKLKTVKGLTTRPTADRVKEAIFNVLGTKVLDNRVLDLFAGTGNIGLEALSRGANSVTFVEKDRNALSVLKTNIDNCGFNSKIEVLFMDVFKALKLLTTKQKSFNLVYLDPPYKLDIHNQLLQYIFSNSLVESRGIVILETAKSTKFDLDFANAPKLRENVYGDTKITYFQAL